MHSSTSISQQLSSLRSLIHLRHQRHGQVTAVQRDTESLSSRIVNVMRRTWDLGITSFGGPPVHFRILHRRFVEGKGGEEWVDEQTVS
jgi:hypothetical protein